MVPYINIISIQITFVRLWFQVHKVKLMELLVGNTLYEFPWEHSTLHSRNISSIHLLLVALILFVGGYSHTSFLQ